MPSAYDLFLAVNIVQETWILASKLNMLPSFMILGSREHSSRTQIDTPVRKFSRTAVHATKAFSGHIKDWIAYKTSTRAGFGLMCTAGY